jgi:hypothetical protein
MEKLLRGGETGAAVLDDALSLSHGLSGRGVGHPHFKGKAALIRNSVARFLVRVSMRARTKVSAVLMGYLPEGGFTPLSEV